MSSGREIRSIGNTSMSHTTPVETVSNTAVLDLLETCSALGIMNNHDLDTLGIQRSTLSDPTLRFSENKLIELWQWIAKHSSKPEVGLLIGQTINPAAKGLLASWVSQTESIGEALEIFCANISLMSPSERWEILQHDGVCTLQFTLREDKPYPSIAIERSMSAMIAWGRALSSHAFPLIEARFSFPSTYYHSTFVSIFGSNITFEAHENCIKFDSDLLKLPTVNGNQFLKSIIEEKAKAALQALTNDVSMATRTKAAIEKTLLNKNALSIDAVCDELALSRQTLYRKLKEEGCDYKSLSDEYKKTEALKLLQIESENITSVSLRLGYKDTSSFHKAFKRWFGMSPSAYVRQS